MIDVADALSVVALAKAKETADTLTGKTFEQSVAAYYNMRRTGRLYQVKIPKFAHDPTSTCEKTLDNKGLQFVPSTDTVEGVDDYADIPMFQWCRCNYVRDADGAARPIAIEGDDNYTETGSVDVGAMQSSFYYLWDSTSDSDYTYLTISDLPHEKLGLKPWVECVKADGTVLPWCIGSAYFSGMASDGLLRSQTNLPIENFQSHNNMIANYQKKGSGYWGAGSCRNTFQIIFNLIKGATKSSQNLYAGCTNCDFQYKVALAETGVKRVLLSTANAANIIVGSDVSVGDAGTNTDFDRSSAYMRNIADKVIVTKKEAVNINETDYIACYLDIPENVDIPETAYISSMPLHSGLTDSVIGRHDGSKVSNTNEGYSYRVQGREYSPGTYIIASDTVMIF